ncbi:hypothetical protein JW935_17285 [candidate division KSB1 bacterium]|nr:hypothetical protein [candidate division KSB1 bacterium]
MKNRYIFPVFLLLIVAVIFFFFCASAVELKLKKNPDFVQSARKFFATFPIQDPYSYTSCAFILKDEQTENAQNFNVEWSTQTKHESLMGSY